jgi:hypothetical protein
VELETVEYQMQVQEHLQELIQAAEVAAEVDKVVVVEMVDQALLL